VAPRSDLDPAVHHRRLLTAFRTLRDGAGLTQAQVAERLGWSVSKVLRIENGKNNISRRDLTALLGLYGVRSKTSVDDLLELASLARQRSWPHIADAISGEFRVYVGLESSASTIREYEPVLIPGLLQTADYARAVITALSPEGDGEELIERRVQIRRERQKLLAGPTPPRAHFLIDEAAVRRQIGGRAVMLAQLAHLREVNQRPEVSIQIVPFSMGEHVGMTGPFIVLEFANGDEPLLYLEDSRQDLLTREDPELTRTYLARFTAIADLATPAARFDRIVDDLIDSLGVDRGRPALTTGAL